MHHTDLVRRTLKALGLPETQEGLLQAHRATRAREATRTLVEEGEYEGDPDDERIMREVLPKAIGDSPALLPLVQRLEEEGVGYHDLCHRLDWFLEQVQMLAGNRPLPYHRGVQVKNFTGEKPRFGFLLWEEGHYLVRIKEDVRLESWGRLGDSQLKYPTAFLAAMDGWLVD